MKILVIFTGGTIGSTAGEQWISLDNSTNYALINNFVKTNGNEIKFETLQPYSILSENLSGKEITQVCNAVRENIDGGYDGIIVTHGTDTIQYTACALAFTVNCKNVPVVMVSANYPLDDERSNGNVNFASAVKFIENKCGAGVFVAYKNDNEPITKIHNATRVVTHLEGNGDLFDLDDAPYAVIYQDKVTVNGETTSVNGVENLPVDLCKYPKILVINAIPGDNFGYDLKDCNAVIIKPFHSGTLNTENENLAEFFKRAKELNIPVFLANAWRGTAYESAKGFDNNALTILPSSSIPALYMKVWIAVNLNQPIKTFVERELNGEFTAK